MRGIRREKVFGPARGIPLDGNAKARIMIYARGYNAKHCQPGQHRGPLTRAILEVLEALLWGFHKAISGVFRRTRPLPNAPAAPGAPSPRRSVPWSVHSRQRALPIAVAASVA